MLFFTVDSSTGLIRLQQSILFRDELTYSVSAHTQTHTYSLCVSSVCLSVCLFRDELTYSASAHTQTHTYSLSVSSVCLSVCLCVSLALSLSVSLPACLSVSLSLPLPLYPKKGIAVSTQKLYFASLVSSVAVMYHNEQLYKYSSIDH